MAYYINGIRFTHDDAAVYLAMDAMDVLHMTFSAAFSLIADYLFTVKPGTERIYSNMRISCGRA